MLALLANSSSLHVSVDVERKAFLVHLFVVLTLVRVAVAVAGFTLVGVFPKSIENMF
jgi:hypothetical protein